MASLNESLFNTPSAKRALKLHEARIAAAAKARKDRGLDTNFERQLATATCLENTRRQIKVVEGMMAGATQPSNIGQYKRFAMDMVASLMPNLIAPDVVSVQALENRVGMINVLSYAYGSDKGGVKNGQVFSSPMAYEGMDQEYTSSSVTVTMTAEDLKEGKYFPDWTPVLHAFNMTTGTALEVKEDENGNTYFEGLTEGQKVLYVYDNETVPVKSPTLKLDIKSMPVTTKSRKLSAVWSFDAQYELQKEYGQDLQKMMAAQAVAEMQQEIDNEITTDLYKIANGGQEIVWSRTQPHGVSMIDHYDSFYAEIVAGSNRIYGATRRAHANFMICGLGVASVLQVMRNFDSANDSTSVGPHYIGSLPGIKVYVNPWYGENDFVLGYKGPNLMDAGYVYAPYMPILTTGMITLADDFAGREGWCTTYGKKTINPRLYLRGHII